MNRYPIDPLVAILQVQLGEALDGGQQPGQDPEGARFLDGILGVSISTAHRVRRHGLTERQADKRALRADTHPSLVWRGWWIDLDDGLTEEGDDEYFADDPPVDVLEPISLRRAS